MTVLVIGGTGFVGRRVVRLLAANGHGVVCMGFSHGAEVFAGAGDPIEVRRTDIGNFDDVMRVMADVKPERVVNLAYSLGSDHPPHAAMKLNILGMDNVFEASRLCSARRVVYASSVAVSGPQKHFGERLVSETDAPHGTGQYALHKRFNEWQAEDYVDKHRMSIVGIRPANGTGPDKFRGSTDHVLCITEPARGRPVSLPYRDMMRAPIHVEDVAAVFVRVLLADAPRHSVYNTGGTSISLGALADMVRTFLPDARIDFEHEHGGRELSGSHLLDNSRLRSEFGIEYPPLRQRVLQIINDVRRREGLALVGG